jgi:hypothetical protein
VKRRNRKEKIAHVPRQRQSVPPPGQLAFQQFLASLPPALQPLAIRAQQRKPPCLLCQQSFHALGVFIPSYPQRWGIVEGWQGGCVYALCQACLAIPNRGELVEAILWQDRRRKAAAPWN